MVFAYTVFEHIIPEDWEKAVSAVKQMGRKLLLIEPMNFVGRYYCHDHPYRKSFKVIESKHLGDKTMFLCDLE